jgi:hypothetical protein
VAVQDVSGLCYNGGMMTTNGTKYVFVCDPDECDTLIEITCVSGFDFPNGVIKHTCPCGREMSYISAIILSSEQPTKEEKMETTTPQVMTLDWVENDVVTNKTYTESDVRHMVWQLKNLTTKQNEWFKKESQLRTLLEEVYADSDDQESLTNIAEIFDVPLTKEVEYTAWVRVDMTVEVELGGDLGDAIEDFISSNLTIDSYDSLIQVTNHDIERVEEGAY